MGICLKDYSLVLVSGAVHYLEFSRIFHIYFRSDLESARSSIRVFFTNTYIDFERIQRFFEFELSLYTFTAIHFCFSTLTATVIVPSQDKPCSQWVSFNTEHEPVLNNAPVNNDACDNFLKRLQKTKLSCQGKIQTLGTAMLS